MFHNYIRTHLCIYTRLYCVDFFSCLYIWLHNSILPFINCVNFNYCVWIFSAQQSAKFLEASKKGNLIPLYHCILCDHLTPVLAYRCLVKEDDRDAPSFLFESVEPGLDASTIVSLFLSYAIFF